MQHTHFPSTEDLWLRDFKARLAKTKSRVTNINLEFGPLNISAPQWNSRLQCIDLTKQWIDHAVTLGSPRLKVNHDRYDLATALKLAKELNYTGLISIEANANLTNNPNSPDMGADPYANVQKIYDVVIANL